MWVQLTFLKCRPFKSHICFYLQSAPAGGKVERLNERQIKKGGDGGRTRKRLPQQVPFTMAI